MTSNPLKNLEIVIGRLIWDVLASFSLWVQMCENLPTFSRSPYLGCLRLRLDQKSIHISQRCLSSILHYQSYFKSKPSGYLISKTIFLKGFYFHLCQSAFFYVNTSVSQFDCKVRGIVWQFHCVFSSRLTWQTKTPTLNLVVKNPWCHCGVTRQ